MATKAQLLKDLLEADNIDTSSMSISEMEARYDEVGSGRLQAVKRQNFVKRFRNQLRKGDFDKEILTEDSRFSLD